MTKNLPIDLNEYIDKYISRINRDISIAEINRTAQYEIDRLDVTYLISKKGVINNNV